jgi:hypothetical protein
LLTTAYAASHATLRLYLRLSIHHPQRRRRGPSLPE